MNVLKPPGCVVIIGFKPKPRGERGFGPPLSDQPPRSRIDAEFATLGLAPVADYDFLPEQYFVEYRRKHAQ